MNKYHAGIVLGISLLIFGVFAKYLDEYCLGGFIAFVGCIAYLVLDSRYKDSVRLDVIRETEQELIVKGSEGVFVFNRQGETVSRHDHLVATFHRILRIKLTRDWEDSALRPYEYGVHLVLANSEITLGKLWKQAEASHFAHRVGAWLGRDVESDA